MTELDQNAGSAGASPMAKRWLTPSGQTDAPAEYQYLRLERSYRQPTHILAVATSVVQGLNDLPPAAEAGERVEVLSSRDPTADAVKVVALWLNRAHLPADEIIVVAQSRAACRMAANKLESAGIRACLELASLTERDPVTAWARLVLLRHAVLHDDAPIEWVPSLRRLILQSIGSGACDGERTALEAALARGAVARELVPRAAEFVSRESARVVLLRLVTPRASGASERNLLRECAEAWTRAHPKEIGAAFSDNARLCQEVRGIVKRTGCLDDGLRWLATQLPERAEQTSTPVEARVCVSYPEALKGSEFAGVVCAWSFWPSKGAKTTLASAFHQRRLYVAMSRARKRLAIVGDQAAQSLNVWPGFAQHCRWFEDASA